MPDSFCQTIAGVRKQATAEEIQADLRRRIERASRRDARLKGCAASRPRPIGVNHDGAPNWTVDGFPGLADGCFTDLVKIVDEARLEYELVF